MRLLRKKMRKGSKKKETEEIVLKNNSVKIIAHIVFFTQVSLDKQELTADLRGS